MRVGVVMWRHRIASAILAAALTGCTTQTPPVPPPWPAQGDTTLAVELAPSAEALGAPFVQAREGEAAGLAYVEVVLGDVDIDAPLPMLLMLHGRGDRPRIPGGPFACVATPVRIIMPRAPDPLGSGFTWLSVRVAEGRTDELSSQLADRADQLAVLLEEVAATRATLGRPIVTGFSQGGMLTFALAVRHPEGVALALPLAGWLPPPLWPASADGLPRIRSMHGADDATIPLSPTSDAVDELGRLGATVELVPFAGVAHTMSAEMNTLFEVWLEQALVEQAPMLALQPDDTLIEITSDAPPSGCAPAVDSSPDAQPAE